MLEYWNYGIAGPKQMGLWFVGKITLTRKLGTFISEKLPFEINTPIFDHSITPGAGQKRRLRRDSFILDLVVEFPRRSTKQ